MGTKHRKYNETRVRISKEAFELLMEFCTTTGLTNYEIASSAVLEGVAARVAERNNKSHNSGEPEKQPSPLIQQVETMKEEIADVRPLVEQLAAMREEIADVRIQRGLPTAFDSTHGKLS